MTTATIVSKHDNARSGRTQQCDEGHSCHFCGATAETRRLIRYTHLQDHDGYVDICERCFCPGCHFVDATCFTRPTQAMIEIAVADTGDCPAG